MPRKDGSGPTGPGKGSGFGAGGGRMGGSASAGPGGYCVCPKCRHKEKHNRAQPCTDMKCPKCGSVMVRG